MQTGLMDSQIEARSIFNTVEKESSPSEECRELGIEVSSKSGESGMNEEYEVWKGFGQGAYLC